MVPLRKIKYNILEDRENFFLCDVRKYWENILTNYSVYPRLGDFYKIQIFFKAKFEMTYNVEDRPKAQRALL